MPYTPPLVGAAEPNGLGGRGVIASASEAPDTTPVSSFLLAAAFGSLARLSHAVIQKVHTTITPVKTNESRPRAVISIYMGDSIIASRLEVFERKVRCDKCDQYLEYDHEYPVDEKGARHRGKCPKPKDDQ